MLKKNYLFCIDLQTLLQSDPLPVEGKEYLGVLKCKDGSPYGDEFAFEEVKVSPTVVRRNVCTYDGVYITCTKRLNGTVRLNFKNLNVDAFFNVDRYALEVANEIREALINFVED